MNILIIGGTGTVGSQVVQELLARQVKLRVLTRSLEKAGTLPAGTNPVVCDLLDPVALRSALDGVDALFLLNAVSPSEAYEGLACVELARMAGIKRIVYLSVHRLEQFSHVPHIGSKFLIEKAIQDSGISYTFLRCNVFAQNDLWFRDALLQYGVYPQPLGNNGVASVDVRDIAEAAAIAFTTHKAEGQIYSLVGPDTLTGERAAEIWSRILGKPITYGGHDMNAWEQQQRQYLPAWLAFDLRIMYEAHQRYGLTATPAEIDKLTGLLGHAPRAYAAFVAETALAWKA